MSKITIGGASYDVKYTFASYLLMHEKHGVNVFDLPTVTPRMIAVLIWGAIIHIDPQITPDDIAKKLTMDEAMQGNGACIEAILSSLPKRKEVVVNEP